MSQEKIKPVGGDNLNANSTFSADEVGGTKGDMGKVGIVISVLAVVLLVIFYYTVNQNMGELKQEIGLITETREMVQELDTKMGQELGEMDARIAELENLPEVVRGMVLGGMLEEMSQKAGYISGHVSAEQRVQLEQAQEILRQVQSELTAD
ncbi:hypothetical protein [Desulfonatronovibrio magnus]|uniref:hypothetical protein n=1 Tax=Desulfonatronovibrio magnus TaxID=698827 RepID=UPI0006972E81|nr:hypothetical protein [Desulfonatronovibrio magnus]